MEEKLTREYAELEARSKAVAAKLLVDLETAKKAAAASKAGEAAAATRASRFESVHAESTVRLQSVELTVRSLHLQIEHLESERDALLAAVDAAEAKSASAQATALEHEGRVSEAIAQRTQAIAALDSRQEQLQHALDEV